MDIFDWIERNIFGHDPLISKCYGNYNSQNSSFYAPERSECLFVLKLFNKSLLCDTIKKVELTNIEGYENTSKYKIWNRNTLKPHFISLYYYGRYFSNLVGPLKQTAYLNMIIPKDAEIKNLYIENKETKIHFSIENITRTPENDVVEKATLVIKVFCIKFKKDLFKNESPTFLNSPLSSLLYLYDNDELKIGADLQFSKITLNNIKKEAESAIAKSLTKAIDYNK